MTHQDRTGDIFIGFLSFVCVCVFFFAISGHRILCIFRFPCSLGNKSVSNVFIRVFPQNLAEEN